MGSRIESLNLNRENFIERFLAAGVTQEELQTAQSQGMDSFQELLAAHGIQAPERPAGHEEFIEKLKALGIPEEVIKQGPQAVKEYAEAHNIELPEPPKKNNEKFQAEVKQYMEQNPGVTEQEAIQAVIEQHKAKHRAFELRNNSNSY